LAEAAPVYKEVAAPFEEAAVVLGDVAEAPVNEEKTADGFGEEPAVGAGNPLRLPIVPRHRVSGGGARSEGQLVPEERATEVGKHDRRAGAVGACELRLVQEAAMKLEDEFLQKDVLKAVVDKLKEKENEVQLGEVCRTASVDKEGLLGVTVGSDLEKLFS
jgi:hypothetical protein